MTQEQYEECTPEAVRSLHQCGDPEQDHLVVEIQHPDQTEAFYAMAAKCAGVSG